MSEPAVGLRKGGISVDGRLKASIGNLATLQELVSRVQSELSLLAIDCATHQIGGSMAIVGGLTAELGGMCAQRLQGEPANS